MYNGKHSSRSARSGHKKAVLLLISLIMVLVVGAGTTLAFLVDKTEAVENTFTPSKVTCEVDETFENNVKSNVTIKNTGNTDAYIRAAVIVTWQDSNGNVLAEKPVVDTDYSISYAENTGWVKGNDGYWYFDSYVAVSDSTGVLIEECKPLIPAPKEGYMLHVEILAQAIQNKPASAVDSWDNRVLDVTGNAEGTALTVIAK